MRRIFLPSFSERNARLALFTFFSLLILSGAFFVFADNIVGTKNIFQDSDQDGLSNDEEKLYGTNPNIKDTDGDGYGDGIEVESGYDPLKPAPGDKIVKPVSEDNANNTPAAMQDASENLTQKVSNEIANILKNTNQSGQAVSVEDVNASVQKVLGDETGAEEIILPEVDIQAIKIKKGPAKNLSEEKRKKQERDDILEYLTVIAYIIANNSPREFQTEDDFSNMLTNITKDSVAELTSGNMNLLNQLSKHGEKIMEELKNIEVPEKMLDTHIKALKTAKYAIQLKEELGAAQNDPLGQIAALAKAQGFLGNITELVSEINKKLIDNGVEKIPLNL
jgi:Bacterial TSP3 repeat